MAMADIPHHITQGNGGRSAEPPETGSDARFRLVIEFSPISVLMLQDGKFVYGNPASAVLLGFDRPEDIVGIPGLDLIAPAYHDLVRHRINRIRMGKANDPVELQFVRPSGGMVWVRSSSISIDIDGKRTAIIFGQDITDWKKQEDLLRRKQAELEAHSRKLEDMNRALNTLIDHRSWEKENYKKELVQRFEKLVFPFFPSSAPQATRDQLAVAMHILERNIKEILLRGDNRNLALYSGLTPMESQIAFMIREGRTSKEIAGTLNISLRTVYFHRENIRKKLNLDQKTVNLKTYLQSQMP